MGDFSGFTGGHGGINVNDIFKMFAGGRSEGIF